MADRAITQLGVATIPLSGNEVTVLVQNGVTKQVALANFMLPGPTGATGPTGPTGPTGSTGATGPTGATGQAATISAVATGSIATGSAVIVNTDGTVSQVTGTSPSIGTSTAWGSNTNKNFQGVYDPGTSQVVVVYQESLNHYIQVVTGTISGTTITFGTPVTVATGDLDDLTLPTICLAGNSKVIITYSPTSDNKLYAKAGTVSAGTVTLGSAILVETGAHNTNQAVACSIYDSTNSRVVIGYQTTDSGIRAAALSVSGTVLTSSTSAQLANTTTSEIFVQMSSTNKLVFAYQVDVSAGVTIASAATGVVVAQSPISIPGFNLSSNTFATAITDNDNLLWPFVDATSGALTSVVIVINYGANTVTSGERTLIDTGAFQGANAISIAKYANGQFNIFYESLALAKLKATKVQVTSLSFIKIDGIRTLTANAFATYIASFKTSNQLQSVILYFSSQNSQQYQLFTAASTNLVDVNFVGFSAGTYTNGQTASVKVIGNTATGLTSLTPGSQYYVTETGSLAIDPTIPSVIAGVALTSTTLLIKG